MYKKVRDINTLLYHLKIMDRDRFKFTVRVSPGPHTICHALHIADC